jgi:hypothetical protein
MNPNANKEAEMLKECRGVFLLAVILALAACTTARVSYAKMTTGLDAQGRNVDEVLTYKPDAPKFICVADIASAPPDTKITFVWIYQTQNFEIDRVEAVLPGSKSVNSTLMRGEKPWPIGDYVVRIYIDQKKEPSELVAFKVAE